MEKIIAGLVGAVASLATMGAAHAAIHPGQTPQATSYAEMLKPIPNAVELLRASNAALQQQPRFQDVQYNDYSHGSTPEGQDHHHHHHHHVYVPPPRDHHHHHHHSGVTISVP